MFFSETFIPNLRVFAYVQQGFSGISGMPDGSGCSGKCGGCSEICILRQFRVEVMPCHVAGYAMSLETVCKYLKYRA